jgi:RHH-type proline utilization regulon transcriptional repressor/proline dehydrogenase/delta 1-pyrroline-5-carboxylate dehydrogenase
VWPPRKTTAALMGKKRSVKTIETSCETVKKTYTQRTLSWVRNDAMGSDSPTHSLGPEAAASLSRVRQIVSALVDESVSEDQLSAASCSVAEEIMVMSNALATKHEAKRVRMLAGLMHDRAGQLFSTLLTDRVPRLRRGKDVVTQARKVLALTGMPSSMTSWDRVQLRAMNWFGPLIPGIAGPAVRKRIQTESEPYLFPGEAGALGEAVLGLQKTGVRVNINQLGEEVLGHDEADRHMTAYLDLLSTPEVDTISVKISSICAQLNPLAWDASMARVCEALERLYRVAMTEGKDEPKLVMLDMEAYRDLELTHRAFVEVLSRPEFKDLKAGIVLQAYLPDSHGVQEELIAWARQRRSDGGAPIQMRLVKGANLAVERVESSLMDWPLPIFESKPMVDASFKEMVGRALTLESLDAVRLGVASHNLFDVAYTECLLQARGLTEGVHFEVLSGMAGPLTRTLLALGRDVLVYSPAVASKHLHAAVAYLVRRMDENTAEENFLRHSFDMVPGDAAWKRQEAGFLESRALQQGLNTQPRRIPRDIVSGVLPSRGTAFHNEADTDFVVRGNREWIHQHLAQMVEMEAPHVPISIAGEELLREPVDGFDPSRPGHVPYTMSLATEEDVAKALDAGAAAQEGWAARSSEERGALLRAVAESLRAARGELIAGLVMDGGKSVVDADAEISEAIDFADYYAESYEELAADPRVRLRPKGLTVITPPWNFPLAIPLGGVFAALMAGNPVILKPARETAYIAWKAVELCYQAGIPKDVLQFVVAEDSVATALITDTRVHIVVLTGGTETARLFKRLRPSLCLLAETGGKNPTIVTRFADFDGAVASLVQSAFGHAGQKCSATSLLIISQELADDVRFQEQLIDAATSMHVGSAWDGDSRVTPLIHPPEGDLLKGLTECAEGESWWIEPAPSPENPRLWSPGIKVGVKAGSFSHHTEFFGPLLSVLVAQDLDEAFEWANSTPYGLTAGFHSLDTDDHAVFKARMNAGNLYINRTTTGAIVRRQPFGGRKASCFGPGAKAGGPNYVSLFVDLESVQWADSSDACPAGVLAEPFRALKEQAPKVAAEVAAAFLDYEKAVADVFSQVVDPSKVRGQDNEFRYQNHMQVVIVAFNDATLRDVILTCAAAHAAGTTFKVSLGGLDAAKEPLTAMFGSECVLTMPWSTYVQEHDVARVRGVGRPDDADYAAASGHVSVLDASQVLGVGRYECQRYLWEQSISTDYHRHGYLGLRDEG